MLAAIFAQILIRTLAGVQVQTVERVVPVPQISAQEVVREVVKVVPIEIV